MNIIPPLLAAGTQNSSSIWRNFFRIVARPILDYCEFPGKTCEDAGTIPPQHSQTEQRPTAKNHEFDAETDSESVSK
ncbi:MAG: hypothetical protein ACKO9Q_29245, partial [Pirellula sp.]